MLIAVGNVDYLLTTEIYTIWRGVSYWKLESRI